MSYIKNNFLLRNKTSEKLYFQYAEKMPIFDYHCHLSEKEILEDKPFEDLFEMWLKGDHYKWRLMRNFGIDEEYITGKKSNKEKFLAYIKALETAFLNPLNHWSQLELANYFDCHLEINQKNAEKIWDHCNRYIKTHKLSPVKLIKDSNVKHIFTTNNPSDDLTTFTKIKKKYKSFTVAPAFRPDKIINIDSIDFNETINKIGKNINNLDDLENQLEKCLKEFITVGCIASDMGVNAIGVLPSFDKANKIFIARRKSKIPSREDAMMYKGYIVYMLLKLYAKHNIRSEVHIGAARNNNTNAFAKLGPDTGYDTISDELCMDNLRNIMNRLNHEGSLPPMILFNLNPNMNFELITLAGSFQDSDYKGKIQYGAAWWFLDNQEGMIKHLKDLTSLGHIGTFLGMLTDSRSFLSYARHYYFRRLLCNYLGEAIERGEMTNDISLVGKVVQNICYYNAINYFNIKE